LQFNAFTGTTVTIDGITNGAIDTNDIPHSRIITTSNDKLPCRTLGNLEAIAINSIQIIGSFKSAGYLVLKADANMCNEYTGPYPIDDSRGPRGPIRRNGNDSTGFIIYKTKPSDSLAMRVNSSVTHGQFSLTLTNVGGTDVGQNADVTVYNMLGQQLFHGNMVIEEGNILPINLSNQARGVYLVVIRAGANVLRENIILQ